MSLIIRIAGCVFLFITANIVEIVGNFCRGKSYSDGSLLLESSVINQFLFCLGRCCKSCNGSSELWKQVSPKSGFLFIFYVNNYVKMCYSENGYFKNRTCYSQSKTPPAHVESVINKSFKFWSNWGSIVLRAFVVWNGSFVIS